MKLPIEPLERAARAKSVVALADTLGVHPSQIYRWRTEGISLDTADDAACALGLHPCMVWPFYDEIESCWQSTAWLRRLRTRAVLASWRERLGCEGVAGDLARRMFEGAA